MGLVVRILERVAIMDFVVSYYMLKCKNQKKIFAFLDKLDHSTHYTTLYTHSENYIKKFGNLPN